jgi:RecA-family ATPase
LSELIANAPAEPPCLIGDWLRQGGYTVIGGREGLGKSVMVGQIMETLLNGGAFFKWQVKPITGRILLIDGEMAPWLLKRRYQHLAGDRVDVWVGNQELDMAHPVNLSKLLEIASQYEVIIFDNHSTLWRMEDERNVNEWRQVNQLMGALRAMDCAAIVVMHATKGGQDRPSSIRGSTQALATADTVIQMRSPVKKEKDDMQLDGKEVVIEFVKARLGKMPDNIVAEVLRSPDEVLRLSAIVV